jgi:flagellin
MNSRLQSGIVGINVNKSLSRLSSGLRINTAADDAAGMQISDALRTQANSFGQSLRNANDAIGMARIADKAMEEQIKILDLIKVKAIQSAQDSQTENSRKALQADVKRLLEELDHIAISTSFNGKKLLAGTFSNKEFQIGAYSHESIKLSIDATQSTKIGITRFETGEAIHIMRVSATYAQMDDSLRNQVKTVSPIIIVDGRRVALEPTNISMSAGTGIGRVARNINKHSDKLGGIRASYRTEVRGIDYILSATLGPITINGVNITLGTVMAGDAKGTLVSTLNRFKTQTGVEASVTNGRLLLNSVDGRMIVIRQPPNIATDTNDKGFYRIFGSAQNINYVVQVGRLTLTRNNTKDIVLSSAHGIGYRGLESETNINLNASLGRLTSTDADAVGLFASPADANLLFGTGAGKVDKIDSGLLTLRTAMMVMDVVDTSLQKLGAVRSDIGSVQQQLEVAIRNISTMQVNVKASESQIRDVDFAEESSRFTKNNILAQAGSYALTQSNQLSNLALKLLQ